MSDVAASSSGTGLPASPTVSGLPTGSAPINAPPLTANLNVVTWQGSYFFSLIFSSFLFGIITHQVITYRAQARGENLLRCWVYLLWILVVTGTAFDVYNCWSVVRNIENYIITGVGVSISNAIVGSSAEICVQLYFIRGIWKVRKELYPARFRITLTMCGTYIFLALASMAAWTLSIAFSQGVFSLTEIQEVITIKLSMSIVLDLCITFDLVVLLRQNTSEFPSYKRQGGNKFVTLAVFLVSRGTTLLATQVVALVLTYNVNLISAIVVSHACLPRVYVWSMLFVVLNREKTRQSSGEASDLYRTRSIPLPELDSVVVDNESFEQTRTYEMHSLEPASPNRDGSDSSHKKAGGSREAYSMELVTVSRTRTRT